MAKSALPRGLTQDRERLRISFTSKHASPGKRYRERLPEGTKRRAAETYLAKLREDDRLGILLWPSEREAREKQLAKKPGDTLLIKYVAETYLPHCTPHNTDKTILRKTQAITAASPWFNVPLSAIDRALMLQFQRERIGEVKSRTVNFEMGIIRHVLQVAHELEHLPHPPATVTPLPIRDAKPSRALSMDEVVRALETAQSRGGVWYALTLFLLHTGARWGETRQLRWQDVDLENAVVHLRAETAKQGRARDIPLLPEVVDALAALPRGDAMVFSRRYKERWTPLGTNPRRGSSLYPWETRCAPLHVGPHTFRHTFATWKLRAGVSIAIVSRWLGHASIQLTVDTYGHIEPADCVAEMMKGPRPNVKRLRVVGG